MPTKTSSKEAPMTRRTKGMARTMMGMAMTITIVVVVVLRVMKETTITVLMMMVVQSKVFKI
jgi:hypothetical protein